MIPHKGAWPYRRLGEKIGGRKAKAIKKIAETEHWKSKADALEQLRGVLCKYTSLQICQKCKHYEWCEGEMEWDECILGSWRSYEPYPLPPCFGKHKTCTPEKKKKYGCDMVDYVNFEMGCSNRSLKHIPRLPGLRHFAEERKRFKRRRKI